MDILTLVIPSPKKWTDGFLYYICRPFKFCAGDLVYLTFLLPPAAMLLYHMRIVLMRLVFMLGMLCDVERHTFPRLLCSYLLETEHTSHQNQQHVNEHPLQTKQHICLFLSAGLLSPSSYIHAGKCISNPHLSYASVKHIFKHF